MKRIVLLVLLAMMALPKGLVYGFDVEEWQRWKTEVVQISESKFNKLWKKSNRNCPSVAEKGKWTEVILQRKPVTVAYVTYGEKISRLAELNDSTFLIDVLLENGTHDYRKLAVRYTYKDHMPERSSFTGGRDKMPPCTRAVDIRKGVFLDIEEVGTEWISPYEGCSRCDKYKEVRIDGKWEDGRYIYGVYDMKKSFHGTVDNEKIDILVGRYFGLDYFDEEGLTTCWPDYLMVFSLNGEEHLVKLLNEPASFNGSQIEAPEYITLIENSMNAACAKSVSKQGDKYIVKVFMDLVDSCENIVYEVDPTTWTGVCRNIEVYLDGGDMWYLY